MARGTLLIKICTMKISTWQHIICHVWHAKMHYILLQFNYDMSVQNQPDLDKFRNARKGYYYMIKTLYNINSTFTLLFQGTVFFFFLWQFTGTG